MKKNVGTTDGIVRVIAAVILLYFIDHWNTSVQLVIGAIAAALIFTALNRFCLLYLPFGFSTAKKNPENTK